MSGPEAVVTWAFAKFWIDKLDEGAGEPGGKANTGMRGVTWVSQTK